MRKLIPALAAILLIIGCDSDSGGNTDTRQTVIGMQGGAVFLSGQIESSRVTVSGTVSQDDAEVPFTLEYKKAPPDRLEYRSQSTFAGKADETGVIFIPPQAWTLDKGIWAPFPTTQSALAIFSAYHIWTLIPFNEADLVGTEDLVGRPVRHFRGETDVDLPFGELAGSLIASADINFTGRLDKVEFDYWIDAEHGWPVKASYRGTGDGALDINVELVDVNDPSISVVAPE